ncbi:MAG: hypothetical protein MR720_04340, partial [Sutterella sp.]|nr:hypothetical protein [Sutterella sp.]
PAKRLILRAWAPSGVSLNEKPLRIHMKDYMKSAPGLRGLYPRPERRDFTPLSVKIIKILCKFRPDTINCAPRFICV